MELFQHLELIQSRLIWLWIFFRLNTVFINIHLVNSDLVGAESQD